MTQNTQNTHQPEVQAAAAAQADGLMTPEALVAQLRTLRTAIPEFQHLSAKQRATMATVAKNTDPDFVQASISGVSTSPSLQQNLGRKPEEMQADVVDGVTWAAVENEAR